MSATVDGARWATATPVAMIGGAVGTLPALITVSGATSLSGMLLSVTVPAVVGTYSLDGSTFLSCSVSENITTRWSASPFDRNSYCTVTVTNASSTRVAGTYSFTASASTPGASPASRTVTNGVFDVSQ